MVGHTGIFEAVVRAAHTVDACVGAVTEALIAKGGAVIITVDHGNAECMMLDDGSPMTAHTTNPVTHTSVDFYISRQIESYQEKNGLYKYASAGSNWDK